MIHKKKKMHFGFLNDRLLLLKRNVFKACPTLCVCVYDMCVCMCVPMRAMVMGDSIRGCGRCASASEAKHKAAAEEGRS